MTISSRRPGVAAILLGTLAVVLAVLDAHLARAELFGGGGSSKTDCLLVLDAPVNDPVDKPNVFRVSGSGTCAPLAPPPLVQTDPVNVVGSFTFVGYAAAF